MVVQEMRREGMKPEVVKTESTLTMSEKKGNWEITGIDLDVTITLAGANDKKIQHATKLAKGKCPISRALNCPIKVRAKLSSDQPEPVIA